MSRDGWIKLHRCIWECELWVEDAPFDNRSAWIDLLLSCCRSPRRVKFGKEVIDLLAGDYVTSQRRLELRWHWSRKKVSNYLKVLEKLGQITTRKCGLWSVITIVKYAEYQGIAPAENHLGTTLEPLEHRPGTAEEPQNKNIKNIENIDKGISTNLVSSVVQQEAVDKIPEAVNKVSAFAACERCLGRCLEYERNITLGLLDDYGEDLVVKAFELSRGRARSINYVVKVCAGLKKNGGKKEPDEIIRSIMEDDLDDYRLG